MATTWRDLTMPQVSGSGMFDSGADRITQGLTTLANLAGRQGQEIRNKNNDAVLTRLNELGTSEDFDAAVASGEFSLKNLQGKDINVDTIQQAVSDRRDAIQKREEADYLATELAGTRQDARLLNELQTKLLSTQTLDEQLDVLKNYTTDKWHNVGTNLAPVLQGIQKQIEDSFSQSPDGLLLQERIANLNAVKSNLAVDMGFGAYNKGQSLETVLNEARANLADRGITGLDIDQVNSVLSKNPEYRQYPAVVGAAIASFPDSFWRLGFNQGAFKTKLEELKKQWDIESENKIKINKLDRQIAETKRIGSNLVKAPVSLLYDAISPSKQK